jgi:hypothetical protein
MAGEKQRPHSIKQLFIEQKIKYSFLHIRTTLSAWCTIIVVIRTIAFVFFRKFNEEIAISFMQLSMLTLTKA